MLTMKGGENDLDELSASSAKYSDLVREIGSGGNITLKHDYYTYDKDVVWIKQSNSVIDGNGAIIDMSGANVQAFYVDAWGVTLKNLTIKNGSVIMSHGAAVWFVQYGTVENCNFINNKATGKGGAVYFATSGNVINCRFENNKVMNSDGLGGAIYINDTGNVINCSFNNNSASDGGAILAFNNVLVENCSFINNTANRTGGACFCYGFGDARNCTFVNNSGEFGGALHFVQGQVIDSNFTNNFATIDGGGIYCSGDSNVANCNLINNKAYRDGGAIDIEANGNVTNCTFVKNTAVRYAGAVLIYDSNVTNCNFVNNTAGVDSGALLIGADGVITNCTFVNNSAINENGGAVLIYGAAVVTNCNFTYNTAGNYGGAVLIYSPAIVTNCTFFNNSAINQGGGALYIQENGIVEKCSFTDNSASFGAALIFNNVNCAAKNCYFVNNSASLGGGAVIGSGNIIQCTFVNNSATTGGAINFDAKGNVTNCSFTGNKASSSGGAIFWRYSGYVVVTPGGVISGCVFVNNSADNGTIYFNNYTSGSNYAINNNIFLNNDGVAIYFVNLDYTSHVDYNWFGNNATNYDTEPKTTNIQMGCWLFLNATADPDSISVSESSDILFKLYSYNTTGVSDYDNSKLPVVNLTVTSTNGDVNESTVDLGNSVEYVYNGGGDASVTASIENAEYTFVFDVVEANSVLLVDNLTMTYRDGSTLDIKLVDGYGGAVSGARILVNNSLGVYKYDTDSRGMVHVPVNLKPGEYDFAVSFAGNTDYSASNATVSVVVNKLGTVISVDDVNVTYKCNGNYSVRVTDENGNPVSGVLVSVDLGPRIVKYRTDGDGVANVSVTLKPGNYTFDVSFAGNALYAASNGSSDVVVKKGEVIIDASDLVVTYNDGNTFDATLTDVNGDAIFNVTAKFDFVVDGVVIKSVRYHTDDSGVASAPISLKPSEYNCTISFAENSLYTAANITRTLTINKVATVLEPSNVNMSYKNGNLTATLKDADGNAIAGATVNFTQGTSTYRYHTDANGVATAPINLKPGEYNYTISFDGNSLNGPANATATVKVNKIDVVLSAQDIEMTFKDGTNYTARLTDVGGNPLAGVVVKVNRTGSNSTYKYKTDSDGMISVPLNFRVGTYDFIAFIESSDIYNPTSVETTVTITK